MNAGSNFGMRLPQRRSITDPLILNGGRPQGRWTS